MKEIALCALMMPSIAFFRDWAPAIAQSVIVPMGMVWMTPQKDDFYQWVGQLLDFHQPPKPWTAIIGNNRLVDLDLYPKSFTIINPWNEYQFNPNYENRFGLILIEAFQPKTILNLAYQYLMLGGTIIVYQDRHIFLTIKKEHPMEASA